MAEYAGVIRSNLKTATDSWEAERMYSPEQERVLAEAKLQVLDAPSSTQALEEAQRMHEGLVEAKRGQRWKGQERWQGKQNEEQRLVRIMHPNQVLRQLRRAGVDARIESPEFYVWAPGRTGVLQQTKIMQATGRIWLNAAPRMDRIGVNAWVRDERTGERSMRTVTTLQEPYGPEWSLMHFDQFNVATAERYRGWRTAMLHLIFANVVTEEEVDRAFGPVVLNQASEYYRQQLQQHRNRRAGMVA